LKARENIGLERIPLNFAWGIIIAEYMRKRPHGGFAVRPLGFADDRKAADIGRLPGLEGEAKRKLHLTRCSCSYQPGGVNHAGDGAEAGRVE
jgi:hypothetical protein